MEKKIMLDLLVNGNVTIPRLLLQSYKSIGLNEEECMLLIHLHSFIESGNKFPTPDELAERMTCTASQCTVYLRRFIQQRLLFIEQSGDDELYSESYSLQPLWEKLIMDYVDNQAETMTREQEDALYSIFENEFGRPLSPIECETLTMWLDQDHHSPELVKAALRESVISGKLNFRYIDRILFEWQKNGIKTLEEAKRHGEKFRSDQHRGTSSKKQKSKTVDFPIYNWLEK